MLVLTRVSNRPDGLNDNVPRIVYVPPGKVLNDAPLAIDLTELERGRAPGRPVASFQDDPVPVAPDHKLPLDGHHVCPVTNVGIHIASLRIPDLPTFPKAASRNESTRALDFPVPFGPSANKPNPTRPGLLRCCMAHKISQLDFGVLHRFPPPPDQP